MCSPKPSHAPTPPEPGRGMLRALAYRNFRLFFCGQGISLIGTWMQQVAMSWLVYRLTESAFLLGVVGFASQLPMLLLAPVAGVYADRWNRHHIMLGTQILSMFQAFVVAALVMSERITVWHIIPLNVFIGCVNAFDMPARQAYFISMIGRREDLGNAIALNSSIVNGARLIGPSIAGLIIARWGEGICFFINGISYWAVLASLMAMDPIPFRPADAGKRVWDTLVEGMRYAFDFPPIRSILLLLALVSLVGVPYSVLMPVAASEQFHGGPHTYGWLMGSAGLGAFLGAVALAARRGAAGLGRTIAAAAGLFGACLVAFSFIHTLWVATVFLVLAGFGMITTLAASNTVLQTIVEDRMRGRIMSLYAMAFMGVVPFGNLLAGTLAHSLGAPAALRLGGMACLFAAGVFALRRGAERE